MTWDQVRSVALTIIRQWEKHFIGGSDDVLDSSATIYPDSTQYTWSLITHMHNLIGDLR